MGPRAEDLIDNPLLQSVAAIYAWEKEVRIEVRKRARKKKKDIAFNNDNNNNDAAAIQPIDELPLQPALIITDKGEHEDKDKGKREYDEDEGKGKREYKDENLTIWYYKRLKREYLGIYFRKLPLLKCKKLTISLE